MLVGFAWTKYNIPTALAELVDPVLVTGPGSGVIMLFIWAKLMTNDATWHLGKLKRTIIRGFLALLLATTFWVLEEAGAIPCPSVLTLHPLWHIFSAHALLCMTSFCKYHRGRLFGFNVELRGHWLCPYTVWLEPESTDRNPIVRHTSTAWRFLFQLRGGRRGCQSPQLLVTLLERSPFPERRSVGQSWVRVTSLRGDATPTARRKSCGRLVRARA